jgi:hypothetical protein
MKTILDVKHWFVYEKINWCLKPNSKVSITKTSNVALEDDQLPTLIMWMLT